MSLLKESLLYRLVYWFHVKNDTIDSTHFVHVTQATASAKGGRPRLEPEVSLLSDTKKAEAKSVREEKVRIEKEKDQTKRYKKAKHS
jgi:hypothetical protein